MRAVGTGDSDAVNVGADERDTARSFGGVLKSYLKAVALFVVAVMAFPGVAFGATPTGTQPNYSGRAEGLAVVGLLVLSALVAAVVGIVGGAKKFRTLFVGLDNRWSTSKLQVVLWTYTVLFGLLSLLIAKWWGDSVGWDKLAGNGLQEQYLILLGGPFAAAVLSKYAISTKTEDGTIAKTAQPTSTINPVRGLAQVVTDDAGNLDLGDFQYFAFNLVALAFFYGSFCGHLHDGFPEIPNFLVGLTSVSAGAYATKKVAERAKPILTSVMPSKARVNEVVDVWGQNLVLDQSNPVVMATIDGRTAKATAVWSPGSNDHLQVTVPPTAPTGPTQLAVSNAIGTPADPPLPFEVLP